MVRYISLRTDGDVYHLWPSFAVTEDDGAIVDNSDFPDEGYRALDGALPYCESAMPWTARKAFDHDTVVVVPLDCGQRAVEEIRRVVYGNVPRGHLKGVKITDGDGTARYLIDEVCHDCLDLFETGEVHERYWQRRFRRRSMKDMREGHD